ncbi:hypothetical protein KP509_10G033700 [Ceratopteris richardii]|uniref:BTB domain-containing protein n=1 Tax=Ceratopteris richardii TaxID=49495 RepID=A0A8T2TY41_CERRI|nr:hypothetical protein KP509_10G033700 [Ceratopteris richardii]
MPDFSFAFNNAEFSDRILKFHVLPSSLDDQAVGNKDDVKDTELRVNSVILAAHSEYFKTLFSNGMIESKSEVAVVHVTEEEKEGLLNLIEYMYTGKLQTPSNAEGVVMLLCLADRFAICSCMGPLVERFMQFPSSLHACLLVLGLPEALKSNKTVQPVVDHCRGYLSQQFLDIGAHKSDFLSLSLEGVKVILDSELLNVQYEEEIFQYLLDWIEANCHSVESWTHSAEQLSEVVRFPWMTGDFIEDVVANNPLMQSAPCQALIMEAVKFKSYTHARQQQIMWKKTLHNRFRPRNPLILENFWGNIKTYVLQQTDMRCQVYFEFPLELVICMGETFQSRRFILGSLLNKYTFYIDAKPGLVKASYNSQLTCCINIMVLPANKTSEEVPMWLEYSIALKRDSCQNYDTKATGECIVKGSESSCAEFSDFFPGWFIERGFSFPRWNLTINGPVFFKFDLYLKPTAGSERAHVEQYTAL